MKRRGIIAGRSHIIVYFCASLLMLTSCAEQFASNEPLTPAQQQLRESNRRFTQTVGEGAILGAVVGGVLGLALGGRNAAQSAALGAGAGALVGGAAGYAVAHNNFEHARTEENLTKSIAEANQDAVAYQHSASASSQIAADARAKVALLNAQYRQKTITASQYRQSLASYHDSADIMQKQLAQMDKESASLRADAATIASNESQIMIASAHRIDEARQKEQRSYQELEGILASAPAG
jgi:hypothetical protein